MHSASKNVTRPTLSRYSCDPVGDTFNVFHVFSVKQHAAFK